MKYLKTFLLIFLLLLVFTGCTSPSETPTPEPSTETSNVVPPTETSTAVPSTETPTVVPPTETPVPEPPTETPTPSGPSRLNVAYGTFPITLDPHRTSNQYTSEVLRFVCQGLAGDRDEPVLGEWESGADNLSMTFHLRDDVQFRDGTPLNAEAVLFSLGRLQVPEAEESPLYDSFQTIQMEALNEYTVAFYFDEPRNDFIGELNSGYAAIISPNSDKTTIGSDPICTGPYYVKEWQDGEYILLAKNEKHNTAPPDYDNQGPPHIDEIKIHLIETHEERIEALLNGVIDFNQLNTKEELAEIKERSDDFRLTQGNWLGGITYLGFNYARPPLTELTVRQALAHAIDKNALINAVLADEFAIPAVSLLSPRTFGYTEELADVEYQFDLEASRQLLAEAGFTDSDGDGILERDGEPLQLTLLTTTDNIYLDMATVIQEWLAELGIGVDIQQEPRPEISKITPTGEFDLLLYDYNWPYPSAMNLFLSSDRIGGSNRVAYSNPEVDILLAEISAIEEVEENEELRQQMIADVQRIIIQDVPWQPILARRVVSAVNTRVVGEQMQETGSMLWHDARIIEE